MRQKKRKNVCIMWGGSTETLKNDAEFLKSGYFYFRLQVFYHLCSVVTHW